MTAGESRFADISVLDDEYELVAELGRGGSAVVYLARDRALGREVAIKVVRRVGGGAHDDEQLSRLAQEARTVARLNHPHIVSVHAVRPLPTGLALVMQWVPGRTLRQRIIEEGPLPVPEVLRILRDVASALAAAHERGVVHRDVKPDNILLDSVQQKAMLSDFGIAVSAEQESRLTLTGAAIGTPTYMAPELLDGAPPSARSDVYALGLVAWEMLTGQQPWAGETLYGVLYRQKHAQLAPIDDLRADVPEWLQYVVERALQKRPLARWAGASGMLAQLEGSVRPDDWGAWQRARVRRREAARAHAAGLAADGAATSAAASVPTRLFRRDAPIAAPTSAPDAEAPAAPDEAPDDAAPDDAAPDDEAPDWLHDDGTSAVNGRDATGGQRRSRRWMVAALLLAALVAAAVGTPLFTRARNVPSDARVAAADTALRREMAVRTTPTAPASTDTREALDSTRSAAGVLAPESDTARDTAVNVAYAAPRPWPTPWPTTVEARPLTSGTRRAPMSPEAADTVPAAAPAPSPPVPVVARARVSLTAGARHSCAMMGERVYCWGANEDGQLGAGHTDAVDTPVAVRGELAFVAVHGGFSHSCGVARDGAAYCWGDGEHGQLGDATRSARSAPVRVAGAQDFAVVQAGRDHSCGLTQEGRAVCWGGNARGQLGDNTTTSRAAPVPVPHDEGFVALAAGGAHSCALTATGTAWCWGANDDGQLGTGTREMRTSPARVIGDARFVAVSAGGTHSCAISTAGDVWCWGQWAGARRLVPARLPALGNVRAIASGRAHSCALTAAGAIWCWGANQYAQLGNGTTQPSASPLPVDAAVRFSDLAVSGAHSCARSARDVWCWGYNADGQVTGGVPDTGTSTHNNTGSGARTSASASGTPPEMFSRPTRVPLSRGDR